MTSASSTGVPTFTSKPYFLHADHYVNTVTQPMGLRLPDEKHDDTYLLVEPYSYFFI